MAMTDWNAAVEVYSQTLALQAANPGVKSNAYLEYPRLVANLRRRDKYDEVFRVVEIRESFFAAQTDTRFVALTSIYDDLGHQEVASRAAEEALAADGVTHSGIHHHLEVGLVRGVPGELRTTLMRLAAWLPN